MLASHLHNQPMKPEEAEVFDNAKDAKDAGWFSRRHQTDEAHVASRRIRKLHKNKLREEAEARAEARAQRSDAEQMKLIEQRPGHSTREWSRLAARELRAGREI